MAIGINGMILFAWKCYFLFLKSPFNRKPSYSCNFVSSAIYCRYDPSRNKANHQVRKDGGQNYSVGGAANGHDPDRIHRRDVRRPRTRRHREDPTPAREALTIRKTRVA